MSAPLWSRVPNPKAKCTTCLQDQHIAQTFGHPRLPKVRVGVWQIQIAATGQLAVFCNDCKNSRRHRASR